MKTSKLLFLAITSFILLAGTEVLHAQKDFPHDTSYYETYPHKLTTRLYLSQKYVHLNFPALNNAKKLEYEANPKLNFGAGITWRGISLNAFYGFSFLNKKDEPKGKTKGLNLQLHVYPRKWTIDLLAVLPKGFHLEPKGNAASNSNSYYYRPDVRFNLYGFSAYRVPNKEKFSYRAAIQQTEWQKKSAGSLLFGGQAYYGTVKGDSALVPKQLQNGFPQAGITSINFFSIGPGIGYAYTLVMGKHFFITGSIVGDLDFNFTTEKGGTGKHNQTSLNPATVYKAALGYNGRMWNISANWTGNGLWLQGASFSKDYFWPTGLYRIVFARKFVIKKHGH